MAADLKPDWLSCLPSSWSYGVTRDGRIFFINEEAKSTTWLHPVTGEAVITGHRKTPDLPTGWEEGYTFEGARCFIKISVKSAHCEETAPGDAPVFNAAQLGSLQFHQPHLQLTVKYLLLHPPLTVQAGRGFSRTTLDPV
ncbi:pleckstrin homology domain-containing family A member 5-like isoform X2 [Micropterus dolomieu]|uniref:pleckstrin homology domain-containing family A member 5-like isoform X2 n=2 Tax=Micropterus TaxID=27705 RepID=UPI001E8D3E2D|nr:pleckstrin homology domain-containing family A member 5-like isoform X2 [Micropterus dolomieu]